jgi:hypothetical protein
MLHKFIAAPRSVVNSTDVSPDRTDLMIDPDEKCAGCSFGTPRIPYRTHQRMLLYGILDLGYTL